MIKVFLVCQACQIKNFSLESAHEIFKQMPALHEQQTTDATTK